MADHVITVTYKNPPFEYEHNGKKCDLHHVKNRDTIRWMSSDRYDISVDFRNGCDPTDGTPPYVGRRGAKTPAGIAVSGNQGHMCKYDVTITPTDGRPELTDDPVIIMDDGTDKRVDEKGIDLNAMGDSAEKVLKALVTQMEAAGKTGDGKRLFFPDGINLILVEVGSGKVTFKVAGPGASSSEESGI